MNRLILSIVILLCLASFAFAQDIDKLPMISVSGTAKVQVAPDEAVFSIDVTTEYNAIELTRIETKCNAAYLQRIW